MLNDVTTYPKCALGERRRGRGRCGEGGAGVGRAGGGSVGRVGEWWGGRCGEGGWGGRAGAVWQCPQ